MSASHPPTHGRWALPVFGLALGLTALLGLIVTLNASAAPPAPRDATRPAALNSAATYPSSQPPARISSANAPAAPARSAPSYQPFSGRFTAAQHAPAAGPAADTPFARANIDWDAVDGWFGLNVTVQYTVTRGTNTIGGATGTTKSDGWMDGIGCGSGCDMQPGDHVTVRQQCRLSTRCWSSSPSPAPSM